MENGDASREEIASILTSIPCQLSLADINTGLLLSGSLLCLKDTTVFQKGMTLYNVWYTDITN